MKLCDLHTHTVFSDGTYTPEELIREAEDMGLSAVALCDHNTVAGLERFLAAARGSSVEAVPAVEFSTEYRDKELHILAFFVQKEHYGAITTLVEEAGKRKEKSTRALIAALNAAGYAFTYEEVRKKTEGRVNRAHIAAVLTEKGYTESVKEAFGTLLAPEIGYYHPPKRLDALEVIAFIRSIGAVAAWAHPFLSVDEALLLDFLPKAKAAGLQAMEVRYSLFDQATTAKAEAIAEAFGLLPCGGSDFHGANKPTIALGVGKGALAIPYSYLEGLRSLL